MTLRPYLPLPFFLLQFQGAQTVELLKSVVETEAEIPMARQVLRVGTATLIDPMSLIDYPFFRPGSKTRVAVSCSAK